MARISTLPSDPTLVAAARAGDRRAFALLLERHQPRLVATCRRALGDPEAAADAAQEAVVAGLLGLDSLRDPAAFRSWLLGIGLNVCRSALARRAHLGPSLDALLELGAEPAAPGPDPSAIAATREAAARVRRAIAALPAGQRDAVALFYLAGLTHAEVATELGTRPGAVKTRLHKARDALRPRLADLSKEPTAMPELVPMRIADLRRTAPDAAGASRHIVYLEERDGARRLPVWIGPAEAIALAVVLERVELPRPGAYHFAAALLGAAGGQLAEVRVTRLTADTFYAEAVLADGTTVDARPSDALVLAELLGVEVLVDPEALDQARDAAASFPDLFDEAERAEDDARTLAQETRERIAQTAAEFERRER